MSVALRLRTWMLAPPRATAAEPRLKLSVILDPALDSELVLEQVSAVHQVITADLVPFAHCALFGPHGKWCTSSHTSVRFSCPTTLGSGRNDPDRHPVSSDGPLSRSTTLRACCWERHSQRSWTTTERWSGATHLSTEGRLQRCAGEPSGITQPTGPQITTPPCRGARSSS